MRSRDTLHAARPLPTGATGAGALAIALWALSVAPAAAVAPGFRVHLDEFPQAPLGGVVVGTDAGAMPFSSVGFANAAALEAATAWDFSSVTGADVVLQLAPVDAAWSCYVGSGNPPGCGFTRATNDLLLVQDTLGTSPLSRRSTAALDFDGTDTFFLRAQVSNEARRDASGDEIRLCFSVGGSPDVPFIKFQGTDGTRRWIAAGDAPWESAAFNCQAVLTSGSICPGAGGTVVTLAPDLPRLLGKLAVRVLQAGTLTLPSGHQLDSILLEGRYSFDLEIACFIGASELNQYQLVWLVPHLPPVIQIFSQQNIDPNLSSWTTADGTVIAYGLLPPLSVQVDGVTSSTMTVSWDRGLRPAAADEWIVHWGQAPGEGAAGPPPFDSLAAGDIIPATESSYTIRGLAPDTTYFVSVSARRSYIDPLAGSATDYRSVAMPIVIGADVNGDGTRDTAYPPETSARTAPGSGEALAVNRQVRLLTGGTAPLVGEQFLPGCATPPFTLCAGGAGDSVLPGPLPQTLAGEAAPGGSSSLWLLVHSTPVTGLRVEKAGADLRVR